MGHIGLTQIIEDEDIVEVYEALPKEAGDPQTVEEALAAAIEMTGLDLRDFEQAWVFSYISDAEGQAEYFGVMLKGSFEESDLSADIESAMGEGFQTIEYLGHDIYAGSDEEGGLAVLTSDLVVAGPVEVVKDVIDVREGDEPAVDGQLLGLYGSLGNAWVKVAALVPAGLVEQGLQELAAGFSSPALDALATMQTVTITMTKSGESFASNVEICFADSSSAEAVEGLIPLLPLMMGQIEIPEDSPIQIPQEALALLPALLNDVTSTISGSCLTISSDLTAAEFAGLLAG
jgi:hypothetical protein